jgi:hypothetical protein
MVQGDTMSVILQDRSQCSLLALQGLGACFLLICSLGTTTFLGLVASWRVRPGWCARRRG